MNIWRFFCFFIYGKNAIVISDFLNKTTQFLLQYYSKLH